MNRARFASPYFLIIQHPGKKIKIRYGELAHRNVFDLFSGADKAPFRREDALCAASIIAHLVLCAIIVDAHSPECAAFGTCGAE